MSHIVVNGMCVPPGGVFTVTRELLNSMAAQRPDWRFTLVLSEGRPVHHEFKRVAFPSNVTLHWAPTLTANRGFRIAYENTVLPRWAKKNGVTAALQMNGMIVPNLGVPTFSHAGDPWPYRHDLWADNLKDGLIASLKRHEHARALRRADFTGWVSGYLRDLVCDYIGFSPLRSEVLYNGLPERSLARAHAPLPDWSSRPMEVLTLSTVVPYKRQSLVIEAIARLARRPGFGEIRYRIVGDCSPRYRRELVALASRLGVADRVILEGRVSEVRVAETMQNARAFAFMSICECFGIPPLEAMTYGTPVIAADCCSAREIYGDAVDYCPADDVDALVEALAILLTDETRANHLRSRGMVQVQRYSWERTAASVGNRLSEMMSLPPLQPLATVSMPG